MRLTLFGTPKWHDGQRETPLSWQRPVALLAIVASRPGGMSRAETSSVVRPDCGRRGATEAPDLPMGGTYLVTTEWK